MSKKMDALVCLIRGIVSHAAVGTYCGRAMQGSDRRWSSQVNYWGHIGIAKHKPIRMLAFDPKVVTCPECLRRMQKEE